MMFRPMRPNPLIPTRTDIVALQTNVSFYNKCLVYTLYSLLSFAAIAAASPYFVYQAIRYQKYIGSLRQRLGLLPITFNIDGDESIWIHAVSVGEALTARAIAADLKARYPRLRLFVSTTTIAGQQIARRTLPDADAIFYFPFDWGFIVRRTLNLVRPRIFVMMETEIWPNLLRLCRKRGVRTVVVNGRISSRSYPRYRLVRPFFRRVLADVDRFCMQSDESARRLIDLGADPARVTVTGSLKFDSLDLPQASAHGRPRERVLRFFRLSPNRTVVVAGSTMKGEEAAVLRAFGRIKATLPSALLVLAPRAPERFGEVERLARETGLVTTRRSELPIDAEPRADVVVLDTIGELAQLYQLATAVFVGGSLADHGGHNILEPAIYGKPIVFGPHMQNFKEIADAFLAHDAAIQVQSERELDGVLLALVSDPVRRAGLGAAARALVEANRGAKGKTLDIIADLVPLRDGHGRAVVRPFRPVR
jgi:3-deoxy-D-manno-octulosonic-acid transferase